MKGIIIPALFFLCAFIIIGCITILPVNQNNGMQVSSGFAGKELKKPVWNAGDWWVVEESYEVVQAAYYPPPWCVVTWKMEVKGIEPSNGIDCYVVEATSKDLADTNGENAKHTFYYRTDDLGIVRLSDGRASSSPDITGYPRLFMVPVFPANFEEVPASEVSFDIPEQSKPGKALDYSKLTLGKADAKFFKVNISGNGGYNATQIWHPGAPWWLYHDEPTMKARLADCSWWHSPG